MERKFLFNYNALDDYLNEQQKSENWTDGELTMLRNNCKEYIEKKGNNSNEYIIIVNEDTGDVSINGETDLEDKFKMLPTPYEMSNKTKLYRQVKRSMEEAEILGIYEKIFVELREELDSLQESIKSTNL